MRHYESIFILNPNIDAEEAEKVAARMQEIIAANGGEVSRVEKWGKRKLAYEVAKFKKGEYVLLQFTGEAGTVSELERNYKMTDPVIKFMTVKLEKEAVAAAEAAIALEAAQAKAEAEKEAAAAAETPAPAEETAAEPETAEEKAE